MSWEPTPTFAEELLPDAGSASWGNRLVLPSNTANGGRVRLADIRVDVPRVFAVRCNPTAGVLYRVTHGCGGGGETYTYAGGPLCLIAHSVQVEAEGPAGTVVEARICPTAAAPSAL